MCQALAMNRLRWSCPSESKKVRLADRKWLAVARGINLQCSIGFLGAMFGREPGPRLAAFRPGLFSHAHLLKGGLPTVNLLSTSKDSKRDKLGATGRESKAGPWIPPRRAWPWRWLTRICGKSPIASPLHPGNRLTSVEKSTGNMREAYEMATEDSITQTTVTRLFSCLRAPELLLPNFG